MNIEITINNALQVVGIIVILYAVFSFVKFLAELYRDVRCNDHEISNVSEMLSNLDSKVGRTSEENRFWSEYSQGVKGTGIVGDVEEMKKKMQELSRKVAQLQTS